MSKTLKKTLECDILRNNVKMSIVLKSVLVVYACILLVSNYLSTKINRTLTGEITRYEFQPKSVGCQNQ